MHHRWLIVSNIGFFPVKIYVLKYQGPYVEIHNLFCRELFFLVIVVPFGFIHITFVNFAYIPNIHWEHSEIMTHLFVYHSTPEVRKTVKTVMSHCP